ncbi:MAG TPA: hypothetical protein VFS27_05100 [Blastocatellia bacterium]|jgi:hypothetical protein|nr:hypothetical protein [Blastocatellia bacterium]
MSNSKRKPSLVGSREPFGRVTALEQIPSVMFEILCLAREVNPPIGAQIASLTDDLVGVALDDPDTWLKFKNLAGEEYRSAISRLESQSPVSDGN